MGFLKDFGNMLGEMDKGIDSLVGGVNKQTVPNVNRSQNQPSTRICQVCGHSEPLYSKKCSLCGNELTNQSNVGVTEPVQIIQREFEGQGIWPVIPDNICFYCGAEIEESAEECNVCHNKLR